jgi:Arc/MetJ family transcription regulator
LTLEAMMAHLHAALLFAALALHACQAATAAKEATACGSGPSSGVCVTRGVVVDGPSWRAKVADAPLAVVLFTWARARCPRCAAAEADLESAARLLAQSLAPGINADAGGGLVPHRSVVVATADLADPAVRGLAQVHGARAAPSLRVFRRGRSESASAVESALAGGDVGTRAAALAEAIVRASGTVLTRIESPLDLPVPMPEFAVVGVFRAAGEGRVGRHTPRRAESPTAESPTALRAAVVEEQQAFFAALSETAEELRADDAGAVPFFVAVLRPEDATAETSAMWSDALGVSLDALPAVSCAKRHELPGEEPTGAFPFEAKHGAVGARRLRLWIERNKVPLVGIFSPAPDDRQARYFNRVHLSSPFPRFAAFVDADAVEATAERLRSFVAEDFAGRATFLVVDGTGFPAASEHYGVKGATLPQLVGWDPVRATLHRQTDWFSQSPSPRRGGDSARDATAVRNLDLGDARDFVHAVLRREAPESLKSEKEPSAAERASLAPLQKVVGTTFQREVETPHRGVLLALVAEWSRESRRLWPSLAIAANALRRETGRVRVAFVDVGKNALPRELDAVKSRPLPQLLWYGADPGMVVAGHAAGAGERRSEPDSVFHGGRGPIDAEAILSFVVSQPLNGDLDVDRTAALGPRGEPAPMPFRSWDPTARPAVGAASSRGPRKRRAPGDPKIEIVADAPAAASDEFCWQRALAAGGMIVAAVLVARAAAGRGHRPKVKVG